MSHRMVMITNPGTFLFPWKTIGKVASLVKPGDTDYLRGDESQEGVDIISSETSIELIKILAYIGESPVIDGDNFNIPGEWVALLIIRVIMFKFQDYIRHQPLRTQLSAVVILP